MINGLMPNRGQMCIRMVSDAQIESARKKSDAAMTLCGARLADCYTLLEVIDSYMVDVKSAWKHEKWYAREIKKNINRAHDALKNAIVMARSNSISSNAAMMAVSDELYANVKNDLFLIWNAVMEDCRKKDIAYSSNVAQFSVLIFLFALNRKTYDNIIEYMNGIMKECYDDWYGHARADGPFYWFAKACDEFEGRHACCDIDLNHVPGFSDACKSFIRHMDSTLNLDTLQETGALDGIEMPDQKIVEEAMEMLGCNA